MERDDVVRTRISSTLKEAVEHILREEGLTHSEAMQALYEQIVFEGRFPLQHGKPTRNANTTLDVRVIVKYLIDKLTNDPEYFEYIPGNTFSENDHLWTVFGYLTVDANNHGRKISDGFAEETHLITPPASSVLRNNQETYYLLCMYSGSEQTDVLFIYYDRCKEFNPATIRFLGSGVFAREPIFEELFQLMRKLQ